ncbi:FitA-like ribbon-helix-helix domain-containing protein [Pseudonocardia sp. GCM10023141]|uniref:FitA-like ribbon-helix-helix domain-containing protein n=1 Tax=Pseudonocardia sp. GCM10023141 TaxID=3252653 RepID=UPI00360BBBDA
MATIQIRDIPDDAYDDIRQQAHDAGQSLQAYMRAQVVEMARIRKRRAAMLAELEQLLQRDRGSGVLIDQVLADLDEDRRR